MNGIISRINFQTAALLAIVSGLVIVCMGMWYIWSMQQQMQTDMHCLQTQYAQFAGLSHGSPRQVRSESYATSAVLTKGPDARVVQQDHPKLEERNINTLGCTASGSGTTTVLHRSEHRVNEHTNGQQNSISVDGVAESGKNSYQYDEVGSKGGDSTESECSDSGSDYEDDDEDIRTSDEVPGVMEPAGIVNMGNTLPSSRNSGSSADVGLLPTTEDSSKLVASLLSNMVTESIDQIMPAATITLLGTTGAVESVDAFVTNTEDVGTTTTTTVIADIEDVTDNAIGISTEPTEHAHDTSNTNINTNTSTSNDITQVTQTNSAVKDGTEQQSSDEVGPGPGTCSVTLSTTSVPSTNGGTSVKQGPSDTTKSEHAPQSTEPASQPITENLFDCNGDPQLLTKTLRLKTVAELKKLCGTCDVCIKNGKTFKRKFELIEDLVSKVCSEQ